MLYEYACVECDHHFDIRHGANEKPELACPLCQGKVKKVFHVAGLIFKGSGWYVTDSAPKKSGSEASEATPAAPAKTEAAATTTDTTPAAPAAPAKAEATPAKV